MNSILRIAVVILIFIVSNYLLPNLLTEIDLIEGNTEYLDLFSIEFTYLIVTLTLSVILFRKKHEVGLTFVKFNLGSILINTGLIQILPFCLFLMLLFTDELMLSSWMLMSLIQITVLYLLVSPIIEELFFRGLLYSHLTPLGNFRVRIFKFSIGAPTGITAILFVLSHLNSSPLGLFFIMILALYCGYLREKYDSIFPPILAHLSFNVLAVFIPKIILIVVESYY